MEEKVKRFNQLISDFSKEFKDMIGKYFCIEYFPTWRYNTWKYDDTHKFKKFGKINEIKFYLSSESMTTSVYPMIRISYQNSKDEERQLNYTLSHSGMKIHLFDDWNTMKLFIELEK